MPKFQKYKDQTKREQKTFVPLTNPWIGPIIAWIGPCTAIKEWPIRRSFDRDHEAIADILLIKRL